MPNITLPTYPFFDGTTPTGEQVSKNLYDPSATNASYETMNGGLDNVNSDGTWLVQQAQIQQGTFTAAGASAGTANLDYFPRDLFSGVPASKAGLTPTATLDPETFVPIPGANSTFYMPWDGYVIFTWSIVWGGEQWSLSLPAHMFFFLDNGFNLSDGAQRLSTRSMFQPNTIGSCVHWASLKNRHWNGHLTKYVTKGWHSAGIRLVCVGGSLTPDGASPNLGYVQDPDDFGINYGGGTPLVNRPLNRQIRVFVRSFKYVALRGSQ